MTIGRLIVPLFAQMLEALLSQLHRAQDHMKGTPEHYDALAERRLADDMYPLRDQIRLICLHAVETVARLQGKAVPDFARSASLAEAERSIRVALSVVEAVCEHDLDAAASRLIRVEIAPGLAFRLTGIDYVRDWAIPQFHFHLVTAYAIMRSAGIPLGKMDYAGHMFRHLERPRVRSGPQRGRFVDDEVGTFFGEEQLGTLDQPDAA